MDNTNTNTNHSMTGGNDTTNELDRDSLERGVTAGYSGINKNIEANGLDSDGNYNRFNSMSAG